MALVLDIVQQTSSRFPRKRLQAIANRASRLLHRCGRVELVGVSKRTMKRINGTFRGKWKVTDVVSFSYVSEQRNGKGMLLGEIFICMDVAKKQAKTLKHPLWAELEWLFVHGLLHIVGYDHVRKKDARNMERMAQKCLGEKG